MTHVPTKMIQVRAIRLNHLIHKCDEVLGKEALLADWRNVVILLRAQFVEELLQLVLNKNHKRL